MSLELRAASFGYNRDVQVLDQLTLTINDGERVAIIGQNGAGKTTTVKLLNGLLRPTTGEMLLDGVSTAALTTARIARQVAYVFQNPDDQLFGRDVYSEVAYVPRLLKLPDDKIDARVRSALELTGLIEHQDDNPQDLPLAVRKFVAIASVLASDARFIVLDEPTAGLDLAGKRMLAHILDVLDGRGVAVLTISHDMRFVADHFPRVVVMRSGEIVLDATREAVFASDNALAAARLQRPVAAQIVRDLGLKEPSLDLGDLAKAVVTHRRTQR